MIFEAIGAFFKRLLGYLIYFVMSDAFPWVCLGLAVVAFLLLLVKLYLVIRARMLDNIVYERSFSEEGVYEGDTVELIETIRNIGFFPLFFVDVEAYFFGGLAIDGYDGGGGDRMPYFISRFHLWPFMQIRRRHTVACTARGYYTLQVATVHRKNNPLVLQAPTALYVYPKIVPVDTAAYATGRIQGEFLSQRPIFSDPFSFSGIRDYRIGDPMSQINFKATARSPMGAGQGSYFKVNQRDFCASRKLMLYMDLHLPMGTPMDGMTYDRLAENGLSFASALLRDATYNGFRVGFCVNCKDEDGSMAQHFSCESGEAHMLEILRAMARMRPQDGASFVSLIDRSIEEGLEDTEVIILCYVLNEEVPSRMDVLARGGNTMTVIPLETLDNGI